MLIVCPVAKAGFYCPICRAPAIRQGRGTDAQLLAVLEEWARTCR